MTLCVRPLPSRSGFLHLNMLLFRKMNYFPHFCVMKQNLFLGRGAFIISIFVCNASIFRAGVRFSRQLMSHDMLMDSGRGQESVPVRCAAVCDCSSVYMKGKGQTANESTGSSSLVGVRVSGMTR